MDGVGSPATTILLGDRSVVPPASKAVASACYLLLTMGAAESRILAEALELSEDERLRIAEALLHSVAPDGVASADDPGTAAELRRRVAEIEAGDRAGVSWAELKDTIERE